MVAMVKLTRNGNGTMITVPKAVCEYLRWNPGDHVGIAVNENGTLTVVKLDVARLMNAAVVAPVQQDVLATAV